MTVWLLPDNIADMLPRQARTMERMRRTCLDLFEVHGFELVKPPLIEYADSLLTASPWENASWRTGTCRNPPCSWCGDGNKMRSSAKLRR